jgi:hypothetical protein
VKNYSDIKAQSSKIGDMGIEAFYEEEEVKRIQTSSYIQKPPAI